MSAAAPGAVAITGAGGMLGRRLCEHLRARGWQVRALVREPAGAPLAALGFPCFRCELPGHLDPEALRGARAVIHCAYTTRFTSLAQARAVNEEGTLQVLEAARRAGVERIVFLSSAAAHAAAESYYGRSKYALEQRLDPACDLAVRPGLILARGAGLFHRMVRAVERLPVIPLLDASREALQTVHVDDLCAGLERALERGLTGRLAIAAPAPVSLGAFVGGIARRLGKRRLRLPLPYAPALAALRTTEALRLPLPISSENLLGLRAMRVMEVEEDLARLGLPVRSTWESLDALLAGEAIRLEDGQERRGSGQD